jgi:hypothetical protein
MDPYLRLSPEQLLALAAERQAGYASAEPYPHAVFDDFFVPEQLGEVLAEAPSLAKADGEVIRYDNRNERKLASTAEQQMGPKTRQFMRYLNSSVFLKFLEVLTSIPHLIPDPHFEGGGHHEILPGGFLKIHADFNIHGMTRLDRRLNVLVYLNKDWDESYGGHFELWDRQMTRAVKKVLPLFNRMVVFSTDSDTYHGHPEPLRCPPERSRKSLALYYYTNGRPGRDNGAAPAHSTLFQVRPNSVDGSWKGVARDRVKRVVKAITPPIFIDVANRLLRR